MTLGRLALSLVFAPMAPAQHDPNFIVNGDFAHGGAHWHVEGNAHIERNRAVLGPNSAIRQRYDIPGLRIVEFGATFKPSDPKVEAAVRAQCFDRHGHLLMDLSQVADPHKSGGTGLYFKTQAHTSYLLVSMENRSSASATVEVSNAELHDFDKDRVEHAPLCNLDEYMRPIWEGDLVTNETVLLLSKGGGPAMGRLMYEPTEILSVRDSTLNLSYQESKDYVRDGRTVTAVESSRIPIVRDFELPQGNYPWTTVAGRHIVVTYRHKDSWHGPVATSSARELPRTVGLLRDHKPVTIVALGDSITLGINVSGYRNEPPYMPVWTDLLAYGLRKCGARVTMYNVALGGMTAQWGADNAKDAVAALDPDLVLIGFGMNDFWSVSPAKFRSQIEATMATVRARNPHAEFVLISTIRFDPGYTSEPIYRQHITDYAEQLRSLTGPGVALLDMTAISSAIYEAKSAKDVLADPMHPDDFLARWYAQGMMAMLTSPVRR